MFGVELLFALVIALFLSLILVAAIGWRHPARGGSGPAVFFLFLIIFLVAWAGGAWMEPFGPVLWGGYWLPFLLIGLFVALILAAVTPGEPRRRRAASGLPSEMERAARQEETAAGAVLFGVFFWVLLIVALIAIAAAYL